MAGVTFFGHGEGVGDFGSDLFGGGQTDALEFHVEKADVEWGVVDDEFRALDEVGDLLADLVEGGGIFELVEGDAVNAAGFFGNVALGMDVKVQGAACETAVYHF